MVLNRNTLVAISVLLIAGGGAFIIWNANNTSVDKDQHELVGSVDESAITEEPVQVESPFNAIEPTEEIADTQAQPSTDTSTTNQIKKPVVTRETAVALSDNVQSMQAYEVGLSVLSEEAQSGLIARIKSDADFLQAVAAEFLAESDPERLKILSNLLGGSEDPSLTGVASDMVYSGNQASQLAGLDLLRRLQPFAPDARDVVFNLLTTESDPQIVLQTINVLSLSGDATESERDVLVQQLLPLTASSSAPVRQRSITTISKWSNGDEIPDVLLAGLNDVNEGVRKTAAYASVNMTNPTPEIIEALFSVLENQDELPRARKGARQSLTRKDLNDSDKQRLQTAVAQMRKQYSNKP